MVEALDIRVRGIVQGVGFRPFVYRQARRHLISGWVLNDLDGVFIHAEGETPLLDEFVNELHMNPPTAAVVREVELTEVPLQDCRGFQIRESQAQDAREVTLVSADLGICDDCMRELFDPADRRYRYPFINCTNCGPRFTIIESLPYDRPATSMAGFAMCDACAAEYADPTDRRFHAQPDACFACGPSVSWTVLGQEDGMRPMRGSSRERSDRVFAAAVGLLRHGGIVAVKGLGGFHLVCDAGNEAAVAELRRRKRRDGKALAVMVGDVAAARAVCAVSPAEEALLKSAARPIVLLRKRADAQFPAGLADGLPELGVMLPATPVQALLVHDYFAGSDAPFQALVMTSGNVHDEPIVTDDAEACRKLAGIADAVLGNDRPILARYDDSVVRVINLPGADRRGDPNVGVQFIRRARGYAPVPSSAPCPGTASRAEPVGVSSSSPAAEGGMHHPPHLSIFAAGPEQKNAFTYLRDGKAFVSQHIGDMEDADVADAWFQAKATFERLFDLKPRVLACDLHPEYLSSKWARAESARTGMPLTQVQHHHAHIASVLGEHGLYGPAIGIALDGTGYGPDGAIWGGEALIANQVDYERFANLAYMPMPGGAAAVKHPLRMAYGVLWACDLVDHPGARPAIEALGDQAAVCAQMVESGLNTPYTSSAGRLFDAVSALLGICTAPTYEGEPAILLDAARTVPPSFADREEGGHGPGGARGGLPPDGTWESGGRAVGAHSVRPGPQGPCAPAHHLQADNAAPAERFARNDAAFAPDVSTRYAFGITKNSATETSTAHDTSVLLVDAAPTVRAVLDDLVAGVPVGEISLRFHDAVVGAVVQVAELARALYGISLVALSGGCFNNRYLVEESAARLGAAGFTVALNAELPPNDGCISYGQAVVAAASR